MTGRTVLLWGIAASLACWLLAIWLLRELWRWVW